MALTGPSCYGADDRRALLALIGEWWCDDQNHCRRCAEYTGDVTAAIDGRHPAQCIAESRRKDKLGVLTRRRRSERASRGVGRK